LFRKTPERDSDGEADASLLKLSYRRYPAATSKKAEAPVRVAKQRWNPVQKQSLGTVIAFCGCTMPLI
jgi:hypothetical protein